MEYAKIIQQVNCLAQWFATLTEETQLLLHQLFILKYHIHVIPMAKSLHNVSQRRVIKINIATTPIGIDIHILFLYVHLAIIRQRYALARS